MVLFKLDSLNKDFYFSIIGEASLFFNANSIYIPRKFTKMAIRHSISTSGGYSITLIYNDIIIQQDLALYDNIYQVTELKLIYDGIDDIFNSYKYHLIDITGEGFNNQIHIIAY